MKRTDEEKLVLLGQAVRMAQRAGVKNPTMHDLKGSLDAASQHMDVSALTASKRQKLIDLGRQFMNGAQLPDLTPVATATNLADLRTLVDQVILHFERLKVSNRVGPENDPFWTLTHWHLMGEQLERLRQALAKFEPPTVVHGPKITAEVRQKILTAEPGNLSQLARDLGISRQMIHRVRKQVKEDVIAFTKVDAPFGWLGNMSPHKIKYEDDKVWRTAEALFQALRFEDRVIQETIRKKASPLQAKMFAKAHAKERVVEPGSEEDVANMEKVLWLKLDQHPELQKELRNTGSRMIVEDVTNRQHGRNKFWGAALIDGEWVGDNMLGKLWMKLREEILSQTS